MNLINRYAIGDHNGLKLNPDRSLDLYSQSSGPDYESNWLPSGDEFFKLTIQLYWQKQAILDGSRHLSALGCLAVRCERFAEPNCSFDDSHIYSGHSIRYRSAELGAADSAGANVRPFLPSSKS